MEVEVEIVTITPGYDFPEMPAGKVQFRIKSIVDGGSLLVDVPFDESDHFNDAAKEATRILALFGKGLAETAAGLALAE